jgi:D-psicose/D-tagatose/L-ribulose 3-epimerase
MMKSTIGICTWTLGIDDLDTLMKTIANLGLTGVQYCEPFQKFDAKDVKAAARQYQLEILIYDPFDCRPGETNGERSYENAITFYKHALNYAKELGCGATIQGLSAWVDRSQGDEQAWNELISMVKEVYSYAQFLKIPLSYEPCNLYEVPFIHTAKEYEKLIKDSGCDQINILLDSFHMNIGEERPVQTCIDYGNRNSIFHISGSNREGISEGNIDFHAYYRALNTGGFSGPCVVEFVLKNNPVNTPPRNESEMAELSRQITESIAIWKSFNQSV